MAQQSQNITFTASADLAKRIDEAAATEGCSRSAVIREAVEEYVSNRARLNSAASSGQTGDSQGTGAILFGQLKEINLSRGTAVIDQYGEKPVSLEFDESLRDEITRLASAHVELRGTGHFDAEGNWKVVRVEEVRGATDWATPPDALRAIRQSPKPPFDPANVIRADWPLDVDGFIRSVREARDGA